MPNMTKRGRDRGHFKNYHDHDDRRPEQRHDNRRVSFKHQGSGDRKFLDRQRGWDAKHIRSLLLQNDDIDMSGNDNRQHDRRYGRSAGFVRRLQLMDGMNSDQLDQHKRNFVKNMRRKAVNYVPGSYYRVVVRHGSRYEKDTLLKLLASHIKPAVLIPYGPMCLGKDFVFVVEEYEIAEKVLSANRTMTLPNGFKISLNVKPYNPQIEVDDKFIATVKSALANRYSAEHKALDLTRFHADPAFLAQELFCALSRSNVMACVIELIAEGVPDLVALNLNKNSISAIDHLKAMIDKLPNMKILHMAHNQIKDVKQLDSLKGLKLEEINLDGNPLASKFKNQDDYVRAIRLRFPKVMKLDGVDLPKPITFDLEDVEEIDLPKSQLSFICDVERGSGMARMFIEQYYQIFDSADRSPLLQAYHDNAHFSVLCCLKDNESQSLLSGYMPDNRNLLRVSTSERRLKTLKIGKHSIVGTLKGFPKTEHDPATFVVDLVFFTPELIQLIVGGLFREKQKFNHSGAPIKYFTRAFIIVPVGPGFCIVNEEFCVYYPTPAQLKLMNDKGSSAPPPAASQPTPGMSAPTVSSVVASPPQVGNGVIPDVLVKQQLVSELSAKTEMNLIWSEKCLNETSWNLEQALYAFLQLRQAGKVPQEAFQK